MKNKEYTPDEIKEMKLKTMRFFWLGNFLPIVVPMILLALYDDIFHTFKIKGIVYVGLIFLPLGVAIAAHLYDNEYKSFSVNKVNTILYFTAFFTMSLIAFQINNTGGFDNSILIYYFYFIPSAIAISFEAKKSIYITLTISFLAISLNYLYKPTVDNTLFNTTIYKALYIITIAFHLFSLGLLEVINNKNNKK